MQFPLALIGIAMAVVVFPVFARLAKSGQDRELGHTLGNALRTTFFLSAPAAAGLLVLAAPLTALIFEWGKFGPADSAGTARVLVMYALGVPVFCGLQVMTRLFYAREDVWAPVRVGSAMVLANLTLNLLLVGPMGEAGLALATSLSAVLNLAALAVLARRKLSVRGLRGVFRSLLASLLLAAVMGVAVWILSGVLQDVRPDRTRISSKLLWVVPPVLAGVVLYLGGAFLLRRPEAHALREGLRK
jgi:putative peptidoglycan lipid II flippase